MRAYRTTAAVVVALAAFVGGGALMQRAATAQEAEAFDRAQLRRVERIVAERYVEEVDADQLYRMAIDGMLAREHDMKSPLGALLNEIGDILSDAMLFLPFALVDGISPVAVVLFVVLAGASETTGLVAVQIVATRRYAGPSA